MAGYCNPNELAEQMGARDGDDPRELDKPETACPGCGLRYSCACDDRRDRARARDILKQAEQATPEVQARHTIGAVTAALRRASGAPPVPTAEERAAQRQAILDAMREQQERANRTRLLSSPTGPISGEVLF